MLALQDLCYNLPKEEQGNYTYSKREIDDAIMTLQTQPKNKQSNLAMSRLIKKFYPFMAKSAYSLDSDNFDDKMIAGCEGLLYAARNFDFEQKNNFFTYAHNCITGYMKDDSRDGRLIHITSTSMKELKKPGNEQKRAYALRPDSLNRLVYDNSKGENSTEWEDSVTDSEPDAVDQLYEKQMIELLQKEIYKDDSIAYGDVTYADIYCQHKGLLDNTSVSLRSCAEAYNLDLAVLQEKIDIIRDRINRSEELRNYFEYTGPTKIIRIRRAFKQYILDKKKGEYLFNFGKFLKEPKKKKKKRKKRKTAKNLINKTVQPKKVKDTVWLKGQLALL